MQVPVDEAPSRLPPLPGWKARLSGRSCLCLANKTGKGGRNASPPWDTKLVIGAQGQERPHQRELGRREKLPLKKTAINTNIESYARSSPTKKRTSRFTTPNHPPALSISRRLYTPTVLLPSLRVDTNLHTTCVYSAHHSSISRGISTSNFEISTFDHDHPLDLWDHYGRVCVRALRPELPLSS